MGFFTAVTTCFGKYFSFSGKASRPEFWWFFVFQWLLLGAIILLTVMAAATGSAAGVAIGSVAPLILSLALFFPALSVSVRRLHDTGKSGWWVLVVFVPFIGFLIYLYLMAKPGPTTL